MNSRDVINLQEAYLEVYNPERFEYSDYELDEAMTSYERNRQRAAQRAAARNEARKQGKTGNVPGVGYVSSRAEKETWTDEAGRERHKTGAKMSNLRSTQNEEIDIYDIILSHLLDEGYAESIEDAEVIMVNMSEDWRDSILEDFEDLSEISQATATRAYAQRSRNEFEDDTDSSNLTKSGEYKSNETRRRIEKKFGKKAGEHADRASNAAIFGRGSMGARRAVS